MFGVALALGGSAAAHDSWLVAERAAVENGAQVRLSFVTGEVFPRGERPTAIERAHQLVEAYGETLKAYNDGFQTDDTCLFTHVALSGGGLHVMGFALQPRLIELEPDVFRRYLREEDAREALLEFDRSDAASKGAVERYTKFAKTIVAVGDEAAATAGFDATVGHRLEIVPLSPPIAWASGGSLRIRVLLDGHPWANVPVSAGHDGVEVHGYAHRARTDAAGEAAVPLSRPGHWFVKAHLIRPSTSLASFQWESFWASLTFRVREGEPAQPAAHADSQPEATIAAADAEARPAEASAAVPIENAAVPGRDAQAIITAHGRLEPWVAAGYRMARRALRDLELERGDSRLVATHFSPYARPTIAMIDGVQAATGASVGKMNLRYKTVGLEGLRTEFVDCQSGKSVVLRLTDAALRELSALDESEAEAAAMRVLEMPEDDLMTPVVPPMPKGAIKKSVAPPADVQVGGRASPDVAIKGLGAALRAVCSRR